MKYSFFGTCFEDSEILADCLKSMANQSIIPNEIIIIDSSKKSINLAQFEYLFDRTRFLTILFYKLFYS